MNDHIEQLLSCYFLDPESMNELQVKELSDWIKSDQKNARYFIDSMLFRREMHDLMLSSDDSVNNIIMNSPEGNTGNSDSSMFGPELMQSLLEIELQAPEAAIENSESHNIQESDYEAAKTEVNVTKVNKVYRIYSAIVSLAAVFMLIFILYANIFPPQYTVPVATVEDQIGAKWSYDSAKLNIKDRVLINQPPYKLDEGIVKLKYDDGVELILEGPAEFAIENKGISLVKGHLFAHVPSSGVGFTVDTANIRFIDLGTDFGVYADSDELAELHVLKGEVQYCSHFPDAQNSSKTIKENNAKRFVTKTKEVQSIPVAEDYFVCKINSNTGVIWRGQKEVDLADIVGGGNGFGNGRLNTIIEANTGLMKLSSRKEHKLIERRGDGKFHHASGVRYIDGIFVPNGSVQISSDGYVFNDFPDTTGLYSCDLLYGSLNSPEQPLMLDGIEYGTEHNHSIFMHANLGVTFDISKIRNDLDTAIIKEFRTNVGISDNAIEPDGAAVDIWVMVDGVLAFKKNNMKIGQIENISIPISSNSHYLTIAVTDSKLLDSIKDAYGITDEVKDISSDWCIIANPVLILE